MRTNEHLYNELKGKNMHKNSNLSFPLSIQQKALWLEWLKTPNSSEYDYGFVYKLNGLLDIELLQKVVTCITNRYQAIRTFLHEKDGVPYQIIQDPLVEALEIIDATIYNSSELTSLIEGKAYFHFDLYKAPLCKFTLIKSSIDIHYLVIAFNHIVLDGNCVRKFLGEITDGYNNFDNYLEKCNLPVLEISEWLSYENNISQKAIEDSKKFWENYLVEASFLNIASPKPILDTEIINGGGSSITCTLSSLLSSQIRELANGQKTTIFRTLLASFYSLLYKYTQQDNITIAYPSSLLTNELSDIVGHYATLQPINLKLSSDQFFTDTLTQIQGAIRETKKYLPYLISCHDQHVQYSNVVFGKTNFLTNAINLRDIDIKAVSPKRLADQKGLSLLYDDINENIELCIEFDTANFNESFVTQLLNHYQILLEAIVRQPSTSLAQLTMLTSAEQEKILVDWNQTYTDYPVDKTIIQMFEEQVERTPDLTALVFEDEKLTYKELNERANQLAHYLKNIGVKSEILVAFCLEQSLERIVTVFAILKAGGAYVPLDFMQPENRLQFMLEDTNAKALITTSVLISKFDDYKEHVICIDKNRDKIAKQFTGNLAPVNLNNLAYIIYTSGSTGEPKGIMVEHKGISNLAQFTSKLLRMDVNSKVLQFASISFDGAGIDLYPTLTSGGALYLFPNNKLVGSAISSFLIKHNINTISFITPAVLGSLPDEDIPSLKNILMGGESAPIELFQKWSKKVRLGHIYGPTETTMFSTFILYDGKYPITTIGKPIDNTKVYILDSNMQPTPVGIIGELYIGGIGVAQGYLNNHNLTKEKFINNPFITERDKKLGWTNFYKTGDLARYLPDGNVEYIGRIDNQIKLRGYRIELEEIENTLLKFNGIKEAVALIKEEIGSKDKKLIAYLTHKKGSLNNQEISEEINILRSFLKKELPEYMIPSYITFLDKIPINANGKFDRKLLLGLPMQSTTEDQIYVATNEYEKILSSIWSKVLNKEKISIHSNFFDLGGHSLLIAQIYAELPDHFKKKLSMGDLFKYPTISKLANFLQGDSNNKSLDTERRDKKKKKTTSSLNKLGEIAIIGMAGRFPHADNIKEFWENLKAAKDCITHYSKEELLAAGVDETLLNDPNYVRARGELNNIKTFDAKFFGYLPSEVETMDPQHRIFMECSWEALEDSGYNTQEYDGDIGIYAGVGMNNYLSNHIIPNLDPQDLQEMVNKYQLMINNDNDFLSTKVAYKLGLTGPAINVQSACATSLVAIHQACLALQYGDCSIALAGGVSLDKLTKEGYLYQPGMILSPDGKCRSFDADGQGTVVSQGVGIVVLKRLEEALEDGDHIYAVIKGSAVNNDGHNKIGFTVPCSDKQAEATKLAQERAGITADTITYVEAHGTGTAFGDSIEVEGLTQAFRGTTKKKQFCALGSVKTNVGHLLPAAGVVGLIKTALCLYHKMLVPTLHYKAPNSKIDFVESPFYVNTELSEWKTGKLPRRAGVNSFGMGGTNAHIILEEAPAIIQNQENTSHQLIVLSAKTDVALAKTSAKLVNYLLENPSANLADIAYTLHVGRQPFNYKRFIICNNFEECITKLEHGYKEYSQKSAKSQIVFMFLGQGAISTNMKKLYKAEPIFKENVDKCISIINKHLLTAVTIVDLFEFEETTAKTYIYQLALFIVEYALAQFFIALDIKPHSMIGYGIGEYVAACLSQVFSLEDVLSLIIIQGKLLHSLPAGEMLSISLPQDLAAKYLDIHKLNLEVNNEIGCVVSGNSRNIAELNQQLTSEGILCKYLYSKEFFNSVGLKPILDEFKTAITKIKLNTPVIPFISNATGTWIDNKEVINTDYWVSNLLNTISCTQLVEDLFKDINTNNSIFLEISPGNVARNYCNNEETTIVLSPMAQLSQTEDNIAQLLQTLGALWVEGININWQKLYHGQERRRIPLPTYSFEQENYWIRTKSIAIEEEDTVKFSAKEDIIGNTNLSTTFNNEKYNTYNKIETAMINIWQDTLGLSKVNVHDDFFAIGGESLAAIQLVSQLKKTLGVQLDTVTFLQNSTINKLANIISAKVVSAQNNYDDNNILVKIKHGNPDKYLPLILVHPIGGDVYFYRDLAGALPEDQPVYALRSSILCSNKVLDTIEVIANNYLEELEFCGIKPPYVLGGSSFGGIVAYQMAQVLHSNNIDTPLVVLIDSPAYNNIPEPLKDDASILEYLVNHQLPKLEISLDTLRSIKCIQEQVQYIIDKANVAGYNNILSLDFALNYINTWKIHHAAASSYVPMSYIGNMLFFRHTDVIPYFPTDQHLQWIKLSKGQFQSYPVAGNHITMNYSPNIDSIALNLQRAIEYETQLSRNNL